MAEAGHKRPSLEEVDGAALAAFTSRIPGLLHEARVAGHDVDTDPFLTNDPDSLAKRFLIAANGDADEAVRRFQAMLTYRQAWRVHEYYKPGAAQRLIPQDASPGAELFFSAAVGHTDRWGQPFCVGRLQLCNLANVHPWRHLRAGTFIADRMISDTLKRPNGHLSYILDMGEVAEQGTYSATGGGGAPPSLHNLTNDRIKAGAGIEETQEVLGLLGQLGSLMAMMKAGLSIGNKYYPEFVHRFFILNPSPLHCMLFNACAVVLHQRTREKFVLLGGWSGRPLSELHEWYDPSQLPKEWGGTGWRLGGDNFIREAVEAFAREDSSAAVEREDREQWWLGRRVSWRRGASFGEDADAGGRGEATWCGLRQRPRRADGAPVLFSAAGCCSATERRRDGVDTTEAVLVQKDMHVHEEATLCCGTGGSDVDATCKSPVACAPQGDGLWCALWWRALSVVALAIAVFWLSF